MAHQVHRSCIPHLVFQAFCLETAHRISRWVLNLHTAELLRCPLQVPPPQWPWTLLFFLSWRKNSYFLQSPKSPADGHRTSALHVHSLPNSSLWSFKNPYALETHDLRNHGLVHIIIITLIFLLHSLHSLKFWILSWSSFFICSGHNLYWF